MYSVGSTKQEKKRAIQEELAKEKIIIPMDKSTFLDEAKIDHRALLEGLKGRTNVSKKYGVSYINIVGVRIKTSALRQWLNQALKDPITGRRHFKKDWGPDKWVQIIKDPTSGGIPEVMYRGGMIASQLGLRFIIRDESMTTTATFYDQAQEMFESRMPVEHFVDFVLVDFFEEEE